MKKYTPPHNPDVTSESFATLGGWELWQMMTNLWYRLGRVEVAVAVGGTLLLAMAVAITGRVFEVF